MYIIIDLRVSNIKLALSTVRSWFPQYSVRLSILAPNCATSPLQKDASLRRFFAKIHDLCWLRWSSSGKNTSYPLSLTIQKETRFRFSMPKNTSPSIAELIVHLMFPWSFYWSAKAPPNRFFQSQATSVCVHTQCCTFPSIPAIEWSTFETKDQLRKRPCPSRLWVRRAHVLFTANLLPQHPNNKSASIQKCRKQKKGFLAFKHHNTWKLVVPPMLLVPSQLSATSPPHNYHLCSSI